MTSIRYLVSPHTTTQQPRLQVHMGSHGWVDVPVVVDNTAPPPDVEAGANLRLDASNREPNPPAVSSLSSVGVIYESLPVVDYNGLLRSQVALLVDSALRRAGLLR